MGKIKLEEFKNYIETGGEIDLSAFKPILLENEVASLFIPAEKIQSCVITIKHLANREFYLNQMDITFDDEKM